MKKEIIKETIYSKHYSGFPHIRYSDLPLEQLKPDDIIDIHREEGYYSENNSYDDYTMVTILRERLETDEEFEKRSKEWEVLKEESRKRRHETYLKLKKEFESE